MGPGAGGGDSAFPMGPGAAARPTEMSIEVRGVVGARSPDDPTNSRRSWRILPEVSPMPDPLRDPNSRTARTLLVATAALLCGGVLLSQERETLARNIFNP